LLGVCKFYNATKFPVIANSRKQSPWKVKSSSVTQEIPRILWNRRFIAAFARARSCSSPEPDKSCPFTHPIFPKFILILSFHLSLFPSGFPTKTLYAPPLSTYVSHASFISFVMLISRTMFTFMHVFFIHLFQFDRKHFSIG